MVKKQMSTFIALIYKLRKNTIFEQVERERINKKNIYLKI